MGGSLSADLRNLRGKPILDILKAVSGEMLISDEGIKINAAGHTITNPKKIYAKFKNGSLDLPSLKLVEKV